MQKVEVEKGIFRHEPEGTSKERAQSIILSSQILINEGLGYLTPVEVVKKLNLVLSTRILNSDETEKKGP